jgi:hypothetical protein
MACAIRNLKMTFFRLPGVTLGTGSTRAAGQQIVREDMNVRRYHFPRHIANLLNVASEICQGLHRAATL